MQKIKRPIAKLLMVVLIVSLCAGFGSATLTALAAEFLTNATPTHVYLNVYLQNSVSGNAYMGWTISSGDYYSGGATLLGDTYYMGGAAAYNGSFVDANGSGYAGLFSSNDLSKWTFVTSQPNNLWSEGTYEYINIPLDYSVVMTGGRTVTRGGTSIVRTKKDLSMYVAPTPVFSDASVSYTVEKGDSVVGIANKHKVTAADLLFANKDYFDSLAEKNKVQGTNIPIEAGVDLRIPIKKSNDVKYTVQPGDQLWGIVWNYYGTRSNSKILEVTAANKEYFEKTKGILEAGAIITLPANGIRNPVTSTHIDQAVGIYRVKPGDTLTAIAVKYYGSASYVGKLFEANKERISIIDNICMIYNQQWLVITR